jgi:hypothetical protein
MQIPATRLSVVTLLTATALCGCGQKTNSPPRDDQDKLPSASLSAAPQVDERPKPDLSKASEERRDARAEPKTQNEPKIVKDSGLVFVKSSAKLECSPFGVWSMRGEVINRTGVDLKGLTIRVSFSDRNGDQIGTSSATNTGLEKGHKWLFEVGVPGYPRIPTSWKFESIKGRSPDDTVIYFGNQE